jgi:hypothetical protein
MRTLLTLALMACTAAPVAAQTYYYVPQGQPVSPQYGSVVYPTQRTGILGRSRVVYATPMYAQSQPRVVYSTPAYTQPTFVMPTYSQPAYTTQPQVVYSTPVYTQPTYPTQPQVFYSTPTYTTQPQVAYSTPMYSQPTYFTPTYSQPTYMTQPQVVYSTPTFSTPYNPTWSSYPAYQSNVVWSQPNWAPTISTAMFQPTYTQPTFTQPTFQTYVNPQPTFQSYPQTDYRRRLLGGGVRGGYAERRSGTYYR